VDYSGSGYGQKLAVLGTVMNIFASQKYGEVFD
jgi:hypothetical protein